MTTNEFYKQKIWGDTLKLISELKDQIPQDTFEMYVAVSKLHEINEDSALVITPNFISCAVINQHIKVIENCLEKVCGKYLSIKVIEEKEIEENPELFNPENPLNEFGIEIDSNQTFGNFVIGRSNIQAQNASLLVSSNLGVLYNPLFIYGKPGLGKTHLLNAIANQVKSTLKNKKICMISGLDFVDGVFKSAKEHRLDDFKASFKDIDLLLVDDIQYIAGKEKTHEVFFSVFNELVNNRKQVCLTADRLPQEIQGLEDRIISRFNQGLNVNIDTPEYETSLEIVKKKIQTNPAINTQNVDDDVISYIASNFSQDVRSLEGAVNRLLFYAISFSNPNDNIDIKLAMDAFKDRVVENKNELSIKKIKKVVCDYYSITTTQLISKNRTSNIATPRHIAMYLCRRLLDSPFQEIGEEFGNRDHSTVMSACQKVESELKTNSLYKKAINDIENRLK